MRHIFVPGDPKGSTFCSGPFWGENLQVAEFESLDADQRLGYNVCPDCIEIYGDRKTGSGRWEAPTHDSKPLKCPACSMEAGNHDRACWDYQLGRLRLAVSHLLLVVQDPNYVTKEGWDASYGPKKGADAALAIVKDRDNRTSFQRL